MGFLCFFRDHQEGYAFYLHVKYGEIDSQAARKPKNIEQVFTVLEVAVSEKVNQLHWTG